MIWILRRKTNVCLLGLLLFACQVYISFRQLMQLNDSKTEIPDNDTVKNEKTYETPMMHGELTPQYVNMREKYFYTSSDDQYRRREQIQHTCSSNVRGNVDRVIRYHDVSYCVTHKIASTFWIRIFRYLYNDTTTGHVNSPFDISKFDTHLLKYKRIKEMLLNADSEKEIFQTFRFMFVREPYARLWSVYVDKFILPDNFFWNTYGAQIKEMRSKGQSRALCDRVSFLEFLRFIVKYGFRDGSKLDDHYRPSHYGCNPCKFKPDFVGKLETMADDSRYILTRLGLTWVADMHSHEERIREEISMLIDFNYKLVIKERFLSICVSLRSLAEMLWKAFQINGYIPETSKLTISEKELRDKNNFLTLVWNTFKANNRTSSMIKRQRQRMKLQAYKEIPLDVLKGIQKIFRKDFELFGYDPEPGDIFS